MTHQKIDHLVQAMAVNTATLGTIWVANMNEVLQLVLLLSSLTFAALKWRDRIKEKRNDRIREGNKNPKV